MAESYREKRARIRKEQKKRFQARKMTGGAGDASVPRKRPVKKATSKLAATPISGVGKRFQKSRSRLNPSVDFSKTPKAPVGTIKKGSLGARTRPMGKAPVGKISKGALGAKPPVKKKTTEKFSSFGAAFSAARAKGIGTPFTYKGKKYTAVRATDIPKSIKGTATERLRKFLNMKKKKGK